MNKLTWDNAIQIGPKMAQRLGIKTEDVVELELNGKKVTGPVWIQAGHPDNSVTVTLGYGRTRAGRVGTAQGFNAYALRTTAAPWIASGVKITKTGDTYKLASTQGMQSHGHARRRPSSAGPRNHARGISQRTNLRQRRRDARTTSRFTSPIRTTKKTTPGAWPSTSTPA